jgi:hypothetical protein
MLNNKAAKLILCVNHQQVLAGYWLGNEMQSHFLFKDDDAGHLACAGLLEKYRHCSVYLIADAREEDYRLGNLPHTSGKTKRALLLRKLNQFYRGLAFRTAIYRHRHKEQRQDDCYLFFAINNDSFLQNWLSLIQAANSLLVGIYPIALLSNLLHQEALSKLGEPHCVLCEQLSCGLRQSYFYQGQLQFSRFVVGSSLQSAHGYYQDEWEKMRRYLLGQHLMEADSPLQLILAMAPETLIDPASLRLEQNQPVQLISYLDYAKTKQLAAKLISTAPELLHMQLIASGQLVANLANDSQLKPYQTQRLKNRVHTLTGAMACLGLMGAALLFYQGAKDQSALQKTAAQMAAMQAQIQHYQQQWPAKLPVASELQSTVLLDLALTKISHSPRRAMQTLSAALDESPAIQLNQLTWQVNPEKPINEQETALISVEVIGDAVANQQDFLLANFIRKLKSQPMVAKVSLLSMPAKASLMTGNTLDEKPVFNSPEFKLKIDLKPVHLAPLSGEK